MKAISSKLPQVGTTIFTVMSALAHEHGAINLSQGFPNFPSPKVLNELVCQYMARGFNQYAPMAGVPLLRQRLASKAEALYGLAVDPDTEVAITAGATQAIFTAISAFVRPGDEVILLEPAYDSYRPSVEVNGGIAIAHDLKAPDYRPDWAAIKALITPRTRLIVINSPHNPSGTTLKAEDLQALSDITKDTDILVLSDEVYEHLVYDGKAHQSVLRFPELWQRSLAVYSFGKTFHNTGWKIGYCIAPEYLMSEFRKVHQFNVFSVNTPMQHALADYMEQADTYLSLPAFYQQKRDFFLDAISGSHLRPLPCEGTYFCTFDYSAISQEADTAFAKRMTQEYGVAAIPVSVFYSDGRDDKIIRLCFAKTEETLEQAGALLRKI
ncbi:MAG: methionine aminotransferase [Phaeodactylibacter sp.]|nr:methionine aminotransferase [Phaeodactylibacter sp.]MCB9272960.1 methionine aminotransferase [Lewinellaceae bacterium]